MVPETEEMEVLVVALMEMGETVALTVQTVEKEASRATPDKVREQRHDLLEKKMACCLLAAAVQQLPEILILPLVEKAAEVEEELMMEKHRTLLELLTPVEAAVRELEPTTLRQAVLVLLSSVGTTQYKGGTLWHF